MSIKIFRVCERCLSEHLLLITPEETVEELIAKASNFLCSDCLLEGARSRNE